MQTITTTPEELRALVEAGKTATQIAQHYGLSTSVIYRRLSQIGLRASQPTKIQQKVCRFGHDLTLPGARSGRACAICHRAAMREAHRRQASSRQPGKKEICGTHEAISLIFALDDRLTRGDYQNQVEAQQLRQRIEAIRRKVVV